MSLRKIWKDGAEVKCGLTLRFEVQVGIACGDTLAALVSISNRHLHLLLRYQCFGSEEGHDTVMEACMWCIASRR